MKETEGRDDDGDGADDDDDDDENGDVCGDIPAVHSLHTTYLRNIS